MIPKRKWHKLLIIFFIFLLITIFIYKIFSNWDITQSNNKEISNLIKTAEYMQENKVISGITYYVSQDGTSTSGTDINNPMSFETANNKKYYGGDKVLFKRGDIFYGIFDFDVNADKDNLFYVGSYGDENLEKPRINGSAVLVNLDAWEYENGLYKLDMSNEKNFSGIKNELKGTYNVGSFIDENGKVHGNRKNTKELLKKNFDFYCKDAYLYLKCDSNPGKLLGKISITFQNKLVNVSSNMILDGIIIENTGVHGIVKKQHPISNVCIIDCVIQNIGGSYSSNGRYGNGIEFWHQAKDTIVKNCIIRNVYDAGYTCQGNSVTDGFYNNVCTDNVFINCSYAFEFFCHKNYTYENIHFKGTVVEHNIVINQGKGWGFEARDDKGQPADLVIWEIVNEKNGLTYKNNRLYNSRALYYKYPTVPLDTYMSLVDSDNNSYYNNSDTIAFISDKEYNDISNLKRYDVDDNSNFYSLTDEEIEKISNEEILSSNDYNEIKKYYDDFDIRYRNEKISKNIVEKLENIKEKNQSIFLNKNINVVYENLINQINKLYIDIDNIDQNAILSTYNMQKDLGLKIIEEYYNGNLLDISEKDLLTLLEDLDKMSENYIDLFSYYVSKDNIDSKDVMNKLNDTIEKYNMYNASIDIENTKNLIEKAKELYNNSIQTSNIYENMLNKQRILNITETITSIFDIKVENCINEEKSKIKITYDKDINSLTSENITVKLTIGENTKITNNGGKNTYTFTKNGTFKFVLDIIGNIYEVPITISNISKEYIVDNQFIKNITKETSLTELKENLNLNNYTVIRNGKVIDTQNSLIATGDILKTDSNQYTLIVCGDINSDGKVSAYDIVEYRKYLLEYTKFNDIKGKGADTNNDNILDAKDLVGLRKIILN